jgi:hypothetical protein
MILVFFPGRHLADQHSTPSIALERDATFKEHQLKPLSYNFFVLNVIRPMYRSIAKLVSESLAA